MNMSGDVGWDEPLTTALMMCCSGWDCWKLLPSPAPLLSICSRIFTYKPNCLKNQDSSTISMHRDCWFISAESLIAFLLSLLDIGRSPASSVFCDSKVHNARITELRFLFVCFRIYFRDGLLNLKPHKHLCPYIMLLKLFQFKELIFFKINFRIFFS